MKISLYTGGMVQTNGYLVESPNGNLLIDAPEGIADWLSERGMRVDHLLLTHQHYDHVEDVAKVRATGAKVHAFSDYSTELTLEAAARNWGMPIQVDPYQVDALINPACSFSLCGFEITPAHTPGHAADGMTFYLPALGVVFAGDTLFAGSIGRTDLPGGSTEQLLSGIALHLMTLPSETRVLSGHGPESTIGREARSNPYLR